MPKYTVKTCVDCGFSTLYFERTITAKSPDEAIRKGHRAWSADGYSGPFRGTSAENVEDGHDYARSTV